MKDEKCVPSALTRLGALFYTIPLRSGLVPRVRSAVARDRTLSRLLRRDYKRLNWIDAARKAYGKQMRRKRWGFPRSRRMASCVSKEKHCCPYEGATRCHAGNAATMLRLHGRFQRLPRAWMPAPFPSDISLSSQQRHDSSWWSRLRSQ